MYDNSFTGSFGVGGYTVVFGPSYPSYPSYPAYPSYPPNQNYPPAYTAGFGFDGTIIAVLLLVGVLIFLK
jgi:hypothetical protein